MGSQRVGLSNTTEQLSLSLRSVGFPGGSGGKESAHNAGDLGLIPGSGRSPGEGNGNPVQYSCLENSMDRGTCQATVPGVARVRHELATKPPPVKTGHPNEPLLSGLSSHVTDSERERSEISSASVSPHCY